MHTCMNQTAARESMHIPAGRAMVYLPLAKSFCLSKQTALAIRNPYLLLLKVRSPAFSSATMCMQRVKRQALGPSLKKSLLLLRTVYCRCSAVFTTKSGSASGQSASGRRRPSMMFHMRTSRPAGPHTQNTEQACCPAPKKPAATKSRAELLQKTT